MRERIVRLGPDKGCVSILFSLESGFWLLGLKALVILWVIRAVISFAFSEVWVSSLLSVFSRDCGALGV
ncbi:hypothetical protein JL11_07755 [Brevundimonas sp. DS20]|nr:hypothetical protein JL11_07755 [Brevundimonas sp. DS20]